MRPTEKKQFKYSWEEAIELLRDDPAHQELIFNSYLTRDLIGNSGRFAAGEEFSASLELLRHYATGARTLLDMPAGNGIATHAFAAAVHRS